MKFLGDWNKTKYVLVYTDDKFGRRLFAAGKRGSHEVLTTFMLDAKHFDSFEQFKDEYSIPKEYLDRFKCIEINEETTTWQKIESK